MASVSSGADKDPPSSASNPAAVPSSAAPPATKPEPPATESASSGGVDYAKAALSEDKIQRFIKSLGEGKNMFFPPMDSLDAAKTFMAEQETFAKKYGFTGGPDYMETTGRIDLGLLKVQTADQMASVRASVAKSIADSEATLADPKTPEDTKGDLKETIADAKKRLVEMDADEKTFNAADLALIKKFKTELEAAEKANQDAQQKAKANK